MVFRVIKNFFVQLSCVFCHLFLISSASVLFIVSVLYCAHLCIKCSLGISDFLEEIAGLSYSIVFLYLHYSLKKTHISPCYSLELCIQMGYLSFSPLPFASLLFSALCKASSDNHFAFLHFFFLVMVLVTTSYTILCP